MAEHTARDACCDMGAKEKRKKRLHVHQLVSSTREAASDWLNKAWLRVSQLNL